MSYKHLSLEERHYIEIELKKGTFIVSIAKSLMRSQGTISREIIRNTGKRGYRHQQAHKRAMKRHKTKHKSIKMTENIKAYIHEKLQLDWSPEQIAGRLKQHHNLSIHHETIYQYLLADKQAGGQLYKHLRHQGKPYRKRYGSSHNRTGIPNRTGIEERPEIVNKRGRVGDWEGDTIIGKNHKGAIVTLDERKTKLRLAWPLNTRTALDTGASIITLLRPLKKLVKTITFDNGKEFSKHEWIAKKLECQTYFANPYHSWERGQNENANGLLRQYFPKARELVDIGLNQVMDAVDKLNSRPRKCLNFQTPYEVFEKLTGIDVRKLMGYALMT
jgi:IS30 family transposase